MDESIIQFVEHARDKGMDHATIRQLLLSTGWKEQDIAEVFCANDLELPIPKPIAVRRGSYSEAAGFSLASSG